MSYLMPEDWLELFEVWSTRTDEEFIGWLIVEAPEIHKSANNYIDNRDQAEAAAELIVRTMESILLGPVHEDWHALFEQAWGYIFREKCERLMVPCLDCLAQIHLIADTPNPIAACDTLIELLNQDDHEDLETLTASVYVGMLKLYSHTPEYFLNEICSYEPEENQPSKIMFRTGEEFLKAVHEFVNAIEIFNGDEAALEKAASDKGLTPKDFLELDDKRRSNKSKVTCALANYYLYTGNLNRAFRLGQRAFFYAQGMQNQKHMLLARSALISGKAAFLKGRGDEADRWLTLGQGIVASFPQSRVAACIIHELGLVKLYLGNDPDEDIDEAIKLFTQALEIFRQGREKWYEVATEHALAIAYAKAGDYAKAKAGLQTVVRLYDRTKMYLEQAKAYNALADIASLEGDIFNMREWASEALGALKLHNVDNDYITDMRKDLHNLLYSSGS